MKIIPFGFTVSVIGPTTLVTKPVAPALFQSAAVTVRVHFPTSWAGTALAFVSDAVALASGTTRAIASTTVSAIDECDLPMITSANRARVYARLVLKATCARAVLSLVLSGRIAGNARAGRRLPA